MHSFQEWKRTLSCNASPDLTSFFRLCDMKIFNMFNKVVPQSGPPYFVWQNSVLSVRCLFMTSLRQVSWFLNEGAKADRRADSSNAWLWWACVSEESSGCWVKRLRGGGSLAFLRNRIGVSDRNQLLLSRSSSSVPLVWWLGPFYMHLWGSSLWRTLVKPLKFHLPRNLPFQLIFVHRLEWMNQFILGTSIKGQIVKWQPSIDITTNGRQYFISSLSPFIIFNY